MTAFSGQTVLAEASPSVESLPPATISATTGTGAGYSIDRAPDASASASYLPTFQKWDGTWLPESALNLSTGEWPFLIEETSEILGVTRLGRSFTQGKVPDAVYEFSSDRIKETVVLRLIPQEPLLLVSFTTNYAVNVSGPTITLKDASGSVAWTTEPFRAWDSAETPQTWENAVTSVAYRDDQLVLGLDSSIIASAAYPLYIDPSWTLSATAGWGASTFQDAVEDKGDKNVKIGWLADNFDDNLNEIWTKESGIWSFTGGFMLLAPSTTVRAGSFGWTDYSFAFKIRFTYEGGGTAQAYFRFWGASSHYFLDMSEVADQLVLKKRYLGILYTVATMPQQIVTNTDYPAKLRVAGNSLEVWWQGILKWSGVDTQGPCCPASGKIKFATNSVAFARFDDVRVWNTASGTMTTPIRNAGSGYKPTQTKNVGTVTAYNQTHLRIRSSPDNVVWGPWTNLKGDTASNVFYAVPDQDRLRYYQLRVTLSSGNEGTPSLSELTTTEDNIPGVPTPTSNTGFEPWYPYAGGLVNPVTGNVWYSTRDISVRARAFDLFIERSYNSLRGSEAGPLGNGWTFTYNEKLVVNADTTVTWNDADGSQHVFTPKGASGGYAAPRGVPARLVKNVDMSYGLSRLDGSRETFDSSGKLTSVIDKNGNKLTLTYVVGTSKLSTVTDDSGITLVFTYDGSNRITSIKDPINRYVNYSYDGSSNLIQVRDPMGFLENYTYASSKLASIVDPVGKRTSFTYDGSSRATEMWLGFYQAGSVVWQFRQYAIAYANNPRTITNARAAATSLTLNSFGGPTNISGPAIGPGCCACSDHLGNTTAYLWDGEMNKIKVTDGRGNARSVDYDYRSREVGRTDPGGNTSSEAWSEVNNATQYIGLLANQTNFRGYKTSYAYDWKGNLVTITNALGSKSYRTYTTLGFLGTTKDFRGFQTNYSYDTHGWLTQVRNPGGNITRYDYDTLGRKLNATTPLGFKIRYEYDANDRNTKATDPLGNFTLYVYNRRDDLTKATDPNSYVTQYEINATSRKTSKVTEPGGNVSRSSFDLRTNLIVFTNPRGYNETYTYDVYDRLIQEMRPGGNSTNYTYDSAGNRASRRDANGSLTTYGWDKLNRIVRITYPGSVVLTAYYDANGNTLHATGLGYTRDETWDALDRRMSTTWNYGSFSKAFSYQYDADSHRTRMNYSDNSYLTYVWDSIGRLNKTTYSSGSIWWFAIDADNRRTALTYPNNVVTSWDYDAASRITKVTTKKGATTLESFTYEYDKAGNRVKMTEANGTWVAYAYDTLYRLVKEEEYSYGRVVAYTYDANGNRLQTVDGAAVTTYMYGKDDQLLTFVAGGSTTAFTYDQNGNLRTRTTGGSVTTYSYDVENRVTSIASGGSTTTFEYSGENKRMKQVSAGTTTFFGYDYKSLSGYDASAEEYSSTGTITTKRVFGPQADELLGILPAAGLTSFVHRDALRSVTRLTDSNGATVASSRYFAFGVYREQSGSQDRYAFVSRENHLAGSLYYMRARFYDPTIGRFLTADPTGVGAGYNFYAYVRNNPPNTADPSGLGLGRYFDGGGPAGYWPISTCYWFPIPSREYYFCVCMYYCIGSEFVRACVIVWASQHNEIPDCGGYCGYWANQQMGVDVGPVASCEFTEIDIDQPSPSSPTPLPMPPGYEE